MFAPSLIAGCIIVVLTISACIPIPTPAFVEPATPLAPRAPLAADEVVYVIESEAPKTRASTGVTDTPTATEHSLVECLIKNLAEARPPAKLQIGKVSLRQERPDLRPDEDAVRRLALSPPVWTRLRSDNVRYILHLTIRREENIRLPLHPIVLPAGVWWQEDRLSVTAHIFDVRMLERVGPAETTTYGNSVLLQWVLGVAVFPMLENAACDELTVMLHRVFTDGLPGGLPVAEGAAPPSTAYDAWREAWLQKAADGGDVDAACELGRLLIERGDRPGAEVHLTTAADRNDAAARRLLIQLLTEQNRQADVEALQAKWQPPQ